MILFFLKAGQELANFLQCVIALVLSRHVVVIIVVVVWLVFVISPYHNAGAESDANSQGLYPGDQAASIVLHY